MQPVCEDYFQGIESPPGSSGQHLNPQVRGYLRAVRRHLLGLHDGGGSARSVNEEHAELIDRLIRTLFRLAEDRYFENFPRLDSYRLAVVAVGGYGRGELSLGSDIDLLFVHHGKLNPYVETIAEAISYRLWDGRLQVSVATRTIRDCLKAGREDLSTLTSYLDARFLAGDPGLAAELELAVRAQMEANGLRFLQAKLEEQRTRHVRMGESLFLLQPHVRDGVGGLRDYHTALWLARASDWKVRSLEDLCTHGFVDRTELSELDQALEFLWQLRNELHRGGRKDDRLHFEAQMRLAPRFGLDGPDRMLAAERLMQIYYQHARAIERVTGQVTSHARALGERREGRRALGRESLDGGFELRNGHLEISGPEVLQERPLRLLSAFALAQERETELSPRSQRMLREHCGLIDEAFRSDSEAAALFSSILRAPGRVYRTLKQMSELGVLGAYLPEFGRLVGMWQQDMYHTYTVDVHSLFLVEQLRRIARGRFRDDLALPTELMREIKDPRPLFLGCILHDIGKGRGGGHSQKGADLVPAICRRLGIEGEELATVRFLVRHHLTMSEMAERRDVNDPRQILRLANLAGTREQLRSLYLLTVADIRSVSPEAWTSWKAGLLETLYRNAAEWLETGAEEETAQKLLLERAARQVRSAEGAVLKELAARQTPPEQAREFLASMPRRYLLQHPHGALADQVEAALDFLGSDERSGVYEFEPHDPARPYWGLIVFARDEPGLFATVTGVFSGCGHDILGADAYTARGSLAVEIYEVRPIGGGIWERELERRRLDGTLRHVLSGETTIPSLIQRRRTLPRPAPTRRVIPSVRISNEESDFYTVIDVSANDRTGLLYQITRALYECGLNVVTSRVATRARLARDTFYVTDRGLKLSDPEDHKRVEEALLEAIRREAG